MDKTRIPPPILVTGCPRSGTSIIAGALAQAGVFVGTSADKMFSNNRYQKELIRPFLSENGIDVFFQYPLGTPERLSIPVWWKDTLETLLLEEGYKGGPWMVKCPSIALLWPIWNHTFPDAKYVIVRRRTGDIVDSCLKTGYMTAFKNLQAMNVVHAAEEADGWRWWVHEYEKRFVDMITDGVNAKVVWPHRILTGDYRQIYELLAWIGVGWKSNLVGWIDPKFDTARKQKTGQKYYE